MRTVRRRHHQVVVQSGRIAAVHDHGTVIMLSLKTDRGWVTPVFFDHGQFRRLLEGERCGPERLVGRRATYDGETMRLLD